MCPRQFRVEVYSSVEEMNIEDLGMGGELRVMRIKMVVLEKLKL